jgi:hypothetical protein
VTNFSRDKMGLQLTANRPIPSGKKLTKQEYNSFVVFFEKKKFTLSIFHLQKGLGLQFGIKST